MTRFFRKTALAAVLCLSISGTAFAANLGAGVVQASALHLRAEASTEVPVPGRGALTLPASSSPVRQGDGCIPSSIAASPATCPEST